MVNEFHAYRNDDGTFRLEIFGISDNREAKIEVPRAGVDVNITSYTAVENEPILSTFTVENKIGVKL